MPSKRETILQALDARLKAAMYPLRVDYKRNASVPSRIGGCGRAILRDGNPGEPDHTLSPLTYHWEHRAEIEVYYQDTDGKRELPLDKILVAIGEAIGIDRTFGGLTNWAEPEGPESSDIPVQAGLSFSAVTVGVWLHYDTTDPLQ
jgi:hypothetical protein